MRALNHTNHFIPLTWTSNNNNNNKGFFLVLYFIRVSYSILKNKCNVISVVTVSSFIMLYLPYIILYRESMDTKIYRISLIIIDEHSLKQTLPKCVKNKGPCRR